MKFSEGLRKGLAIREKLGRPLLRGRHRCGGFVVAHGRDQ